MNIKEVMTLAPISLGLLGSEHLHQLMKKTFQILLKLLKLKLKT
jgi:hypothetical protein